MLGWTKEDSLNVADVLKETPVPTSYAELVAEFLEKTGNTPKEIIEKVKSGEIPSSEYRSIGEYVKAMET